MNNAKKPRKQISASLIRQVWIKMISEGNAPVMCLRVRENIGDDCDDLRICWCCGKQGYQERAHIVPHSLGGPDTPENLFLLCSACHLQAPDVRSPKWFFEWIDSEATRQLEQEAAFWRMAHAALEEACGSEMSEEQSERFCALFPAAASEAMADATSHGCEVVRSTGRAAVMAAMDQTLTDMRRVLN
ncbi:HNH nuclease [Pseudomonas syringae pv. actinidiae ICMP 19099]|uniref:HNH endonuclease n=1 Tax=Pseudomonas syringae TaxID=317 RepID=UPI0003576DE9|nr:HNH endonuclease signature motif containing protein [Pseudomonas syringae]EPN22698.1 HNH nuclease [Pseudomonas syringae pv. actinidiae ICMP 19099]